MTLTRSPEYLRSLLHELITLSKEAEWVEFKHNNANPEIIGEYISALANSAALLRKVNAYLIWGIDDKSHDIVGTTFKPAVAKVGDEELENWLLRLLSPKSIFVSLSFQSRKSLWCYWKLERRSATLYGL